MDLLVIIPLDDLTSIVAPFIASFLTFSTCLVVTELPVLVDSASKTAFTALFNTLEDTVHRPPSTPLRPDKTTAPVERSVALKPSILLPCEFAAFANDELVISPAAVLPSLTAPLTALLRTTLISEAFIVRPAFV